MFQLGLQRFISNWKLAKHDQINKQSNKENKPEKTDAPGMVLPLSPCPPYEVKSCASMSFFSLCANLSSIPKRGSCTSRNPASWCSKT